MNPCRFDSQQPLSPGGPLRTLWRTLLDWVGAEVRVTVGDAHSGFAFASLTGLVVGLDLEEDHLLIRLDNGSYLIVYQDMIEGVGVGNALVEVGYVAGDIEFVHLDWPTDPSRPLES